MSGPLLSEREIELIIDGGVSSAAWVWRHCGPEKAEQMRAEFMEEWNVGVELWNESCDRLADYAIRKGEGVAPQAGFEAVRIYEDER